MLLDYKKIVSMLLVLVASIICGNLPTNALAEGFHVKTLERMSWRFPVLLGLNKTVTDRINYVLFASIFDFDMAGIPPLNAIDSLKAFDERDFHYLTDLNFNILRNDKRVFSISFNGQGCGASCSSFTKSLAFDATTGRLLTDFDLFTESGRTALLADMRFGNIKRIKKQISILRQSKRNKNQLDIIGLENMFNDCLKNLQSKDWYTWVGDMQMQLSSINFSQGQCVMDNLRDFDDLGGLFSYKKLKPWLSVYGRHILLDERLTGKPMWPTAQLLYGFIGKNPVSMYINESYDFSNIKNLEITGYYFYNRYRKPILLKGKWKDGKMDLEEFENGQEQPQAFITLVSNQNGIQGQWKSLDGTKVFEVEFQP